MPQSAAMPSPFPPIADYAFLSNCHTGALVAPDGAVDWLCVPRFDSPSIFGTLLDREAGSFRFGPFGINVPSARIYEPGTNILNTTWHTPDRLGLRAGRADDRPDPARGRGHPAHARAGRRGRPSPARADGALHGGLGRHGAALRAGLRLRADAGRVVAAGRPPHRRCERGGRDGQAAQQHAARGGGPRRRRRAHTLQKGEQAFCSLSWAEELASPEDMDEANARLERDRRLLARLDLARPGCPTTASGGRSSARRSRSRGSPTCRPARPWPP